MVLALLAGYLLDLPWFSALWASTPGPPPPIEEPEPPPEPTPDIRTARLVAAGDIIVHLTQVEQAFAGGSYDFTPSFSFITPSLQSADLTVGNFETVLAGPERGYSGYPAFNTPDELAQNLKQAGILSTANNHS